MPGTWTEGENLIRETATLSSMAGGKWEIQDAERNYCKYVHFWSLLFDEENIVHNNSRMYLT